jgi:capsular exopolysaccharide synthesis family protein
VEEFDVKGVKMGRVDKALSRVAQPAADSSERATLFAPAWSVADRSKADGATDASREVRGGFETARAVGSAVKLSSKLRERLAFGVDGNPAMIEQYRRLAATLHHARQSNGLRSVMVTSAMPGDGKTLTAINLSLVLSESYRSRVLLIDADLRRPSIPTVIDMQSASGLSEVLRANHEQKLALMSLSPRLTILPAGQPISNSIEALTSPRMQQILDEAVTKFDCVVLDAPPVGPATDARILTQMVDATLFVIHAGKTQYTDIKRALDFIGADRILGIVLNGIEDDRRSSYYYQGSPDTVDASYSLSTKS